MSNSTERSQTPFLRPLISVFMVILLSSEVICNARAESSPFRLRPFLYDGIIHTTGHPYYQQALSREHRLQEKASKLQRLQRTCTNVDVRMNARITQLRERQENLARNHSWSACAQRELILTNQINSIRSSSPTRLRGRSLRRYNDLNEELLSIRNQSAWWQKEVSFLEYQTYVAKTYLRRYCC